MADINVRTYDPAKIMVVFGTIIFTGFAEGTMLTIIPNGEGFEKSKGADGGIDRTNKNVNDYSIPISLKRSSPTNQALSLVYTADKLSNTGKFPLTIKDLQGISLFFAAQAWVTKDPDAEEGDSMPTREWLLHTGIAANLTAGNTYE